MPRYANVVVTVHGDLAPALKRFTRKVQNELGSKLKATSRLFAYSKPSVRRRAKRARARVRARKIERAREAAADARGWM